MNIYGNHIVHQISHNPEDMNQDQEQNSTWTTNSTQFEFELHSSIGQKIARKLCPISVLILIQKVVGPLFRRKVPVFLVALVNYYRIGECRKWSLKDNFYCHRHEFGGKNTPPLLNEATKSKVFNVRWLMEFLICGYKIC